MRLATKLAAVATAALVLGAAPAALAADETHVCDQLFREGFEGPCKVALGAFCIVFPRHPICN